MRIGLHTSISKSLEGAALRAAELGANTFQIFSASPRQWKASSPSAASIALLNRARDKYDLTPLVIHDNYLISLAAADDVVYAKSVGSLPRRTGTRHRHRRRILISPPRKLQRTDGRTRDLSFSARNRPSRHWQGKFGKLMLLAEMHRRRRRANRRTLRRTSRHPRIRPAPDGSAGRILSRYLPPARLRP